MVTANCGLLLIITTVIGEVVHTELLLVASKHEHIMKIMF